MENEYLKYCRYYKGEETNPYRNYKTEKERYIAHFWEAEMRFCIHGNKPYFINEEYISMMSDCSPEIRHITEDKTLPIEVRGMVAFFIDDIYIIPRWLTHHILSIMAKSDACRGRLSGFGFNYI